VLLLTKRRNMFYLTGDGRLCAYAMITQEARWRWVPGDGRRGCQSPRLHDHVVGFDDEVGRSTPLPTTPHFGISAVRSAWSTPS